MKPIRLVALASLGALAGGLAWGAASGNPAVRPDPGDPALVALGRDVYAAQCASCHGDRLQGQPNWRQPGADGRLQAPPHDATGHTWHHDDDTLLAIVRVGTRAFTGRDLPTDMGGFADRLSEREIAASIAFIKSTWPAAIRARQAEITARAQAERRKP